MCGDGHGTNYLMSEATFEKDVDGAFKNNASKAPSDVKKIIIIHVQMMQNVTCISCCIRCNISHFYFETKVAT